MWSMVRQCTQHSRILRCSVRMGFEWSSNRLRIRLEFAWNLTGFRLEFANWSSHSFGILFELEFAFAWNSLETRLEFAWNSSRLEFESRPSRARWKPAWEWEREVLRNAPASTVNLCLGKQVALRSSLILSIQLSKSKRLIVENVTGANPHPWHCLANKSGN